MTTYTPKEFAAHLASTGRRMHPQLTRTVNKAGMNIQADWRRRATAANPPGSHAANYPSTIAKNRGTVTAGVYSISVEAKLGRGQKNLGSVLEYGGANNAPQRSNIAALNAEAPNLAQWLAKIAKDVI